MEETLERGASVSRVARKHGVNAYQVFAWRKLYKIGRLEDGLPGSVKLLPVHVAEERAREVPVESSPSSAGAIHIELPGRALISVEGKVDAATLRAVLASLVS